MKYLKKFKINESKIPDGLLSLKDIENYFSDFIDDEWEINESNAEFPRYVKIEGDDINTTMSNMKKSDIHRSNYNYFNRIINLSLRISTIVDKIKLLNIISNSYSMFNKGLSHFISAESLKLVSFNHYIDGTYLKFKFDFLEPLIEGDVDRVDEEISEFHDYLKGYFIQKANAHTTRWYQHAVKIEIVDKDVVILDCEKLSFKQMDTLRRYIDDRFLEKSTNAKYNKRRLDNGEIDLDTPGHFGQRINFSYFEYKCKISGDKLIYNDIKKIDLA